LPLSTLVLFLLRSPRPRSPLFPYTTLFRSYRRPVAAGPSGLGGAVHAVGPRRPQEKRTLNPLIGSLCSAPLSVTAQSAVPPPPRDRKSTRLNSSHVSISYAVFCLKKKTTQQ